MYIRLYVFIGGTLACLCICDVDVICVSHDLTGFTQVKEKSGRKIISQGQGKVGEF